MVGWLVGIAFPCSWPPCAGWVGGCKRTSGGGSPGALESQLRHHCSLLQLLRSLFTQDAQKRCRWLVCGWWWVVSWPIMGRLNLILSLALLPMPLPTTEISSALCFLALIARSSRCRYSRLYWESLRYRCRVLGNLRSHFPLVCCRPLPGSRLKRKK